MGLPIAPAAVTLIVPVLPAELGLDANAAVITPELDPDCPFDTESQSEPEITLAVQFIRHADFDFIQTVENIKLGQGQSVNPPDFDGLTYHHGVEPSAAAFAPRGGAEFMADTAQCFADVIELFGRERPRPDAGGVGFCNTQNIPDRFRPDPCTACGLSRHGVR